jgi:uncharacterized membrane protein YeaQ/YmgE (transglycosylase-associated protein family)
MLTFSRSIARLLRATVGFSGGLSLVFVGFLLFGTLIGAVIRLLVAGRAGSWGVSMLSGGGGALLGGSLGRLGALRGDHDSGGFSMALLGAFALVVVYHLVAAMRRTPA